MSAHQKVATFQINGGQKQGGNVAGYFCTPEGHVLHAIAGPVDAATLLKEAKWVVESTKKAMAESKGDGAKFKALFRQWHADRLRQESGLVVEPVTFDLEKPDDNNALTYRDPSGRAVPSDPNADTRMPLPPRSTPSA